jgi:hypothetical protein
MTYQKLKTLTIIECYSGIESMALLMDGRVAVGIKKCSCFYYKREYEDEVYIYNIDTGKAEQIFLNDAAVANHMVQLSDGSLCFNNGRSDLTVWK